MQHPSCRSAFMRLLAICAVLGFALLAQAQSDALPSWNDSPAKQAIVAFVKETTDQGSPKFVPPEARIATFDQDGTLWAEHPMYPQLAYCLDRLAAVAKAKPELASQEPFKTALSGNRNAIAALSKQDLENILAVTLSGMPVDAFKAQVQSWLDTAKDPRWGRPYTELTYQPMRELMQYLRANGYKIYIVTRFGAFPRVLYDQAKKQGWTVISMKNDWKRVFSFEQ
jgi:hypothetical protein